ARYCRPFREGCLSVSIQNADAPPTRGGTAWRSSDMMTLRQVEVIRGGMVTGTIGGAAKLLNVSAPGISRLVKYTEKSLGVRFFQRQSGRYFPTPEAQNIFEQINGVYKRSMISPRSSPKSDTVRCQSCALVRCRAS